MATVILEIPEEQHEELKRHAAAEGLSVSELLLNASERIAPRISQTDLFERLKSLPRIDFGMSGADLVREGREEFVERLYQLPRTQTTRDPVDVIRDARDGGRRSSS